MNRIKPLYLLFFIPYLLAAYFNVGFFHPDEHYQILEFANWYLGNIPASELPWEFNEQMRPTLQPMFTVMVWKLYLIFFKFNPYTLTFILRLITGLLSVWAFNQLYKLFARPSRLYWLWVFMLWFIPSVAVRYSSETLSVIFFVLGLSYIMYYRNRYIVLGAFLIALSFWLRFQIAFMILGFALWLLVYKKLSFKQIGIGLLIFFITCLGLILLDSHFYGNWVCTPYQYYYQNIYLDKASQIFGQQGWLFYPRSYFKYLFPPFSILLVLLAYRYFRQNYSHPIVWVIIPFTLIHFWVGHKEIRFLFPLYIFVPIILTYSECLIIQYYTRYSNLFYILIIVNILLLTGAVLKPAEKFIFNTQQLSENYTYPKSIQIDNSVYATYLMNYPFYGVTLNQQPTTRYIVVEKQTSQSIHCQTTYFVITQPHKWLFWIKEEPMDKIRYIKANGH